MHLAWALYLVPSESKVTMKVFQMSNALSGDQSRLNDESVNIRQQRLSSLIVEALESKKGQLASDFSTSANQVGVRYVAIDNLLPQEIADQIGKCFPSVENMRLMKSFREKKYTSKSFDDFDSLLRDITFAFQDRRVVEIISEITGITEQVPDSKLYAGGLSAMARGHFLQPHIDNSHDSSRNYYRTLNLLYYVTPAWNEEDGGNLMLWDKSVRQSVKIHSRFNRLVLMETNPWSWHSVDTVVKDDLRKCVSNYYFSKRSPTGEDYFNITAFSAPPSQPFRRVWSRIDATVRQMIRLVKPSGVGIVDVYEGLPR